MKSKGYDERADMWSCGIVAYILLGGYAPFDGPLEELAFKILQGDYEFHDEYWAHISNDAKDLVASLMQGDPERRLKAEEALQSDWMIAEEETLTVKDLSNAQEQIRKRLPVDKFRGAVKAVRTTGICFYAFVWKPLRIARVSLPVRTAPCFRFGHVIFLWMKGLLFAACTHFMLCSTIFFLDDADYGDEQTQFVGG